MCPITGCVWLAIAGVVAIGGFLGLTLGSKNKKTSDEN